RTAAHLRGTAALGSERSVMTMRRMPAKSAFPTCRRLDDRRVAAIEFAMVLPLLCLLTFGVIEMGMMMATLTTLEGGLKEASRYGITGQAPDDASRIEKIRDILNDHTLDLVDFAEAEFSVK